MGAPKHGRWRKRYLYVLVKCHAALMDKLVASCYITYFYFEKVDE